MKSVAELKGFADGFFSRCRELGIGEATQGVLAKIASSLDGDVRDALSSHADIVVNDGSPLSYVKRALDIARAAEGAAVNTADAQRSGGQAYSQKERKLRVTNPESRLNPIQRVVHTFMNPDESGDARSTGRKLLGEVKTSAELFLKGQLMKCAVTPHSPLAAPQSGPSLPMGPGPGSGPRVPDPSMFTTLGRSILPKQPKPVSPKAQAEQPSAAAGSEEQPQPVGKFRGHVSALAAKLNPQSHRDSVTALASMAGK
jgi:hypothetical protein